MKQLRALLYKEWRDQRALALGALALIAATLMIAKLAAGKRFDVLLREEYVYPAVLGVLFVAVATETITRDAGSEVERSVLRLPTSRTRVWAGKGLFCLLAFAGCVAALLFAETILRLFEHSLGAPLRTFLVHPMHLGAALCAACACSAMACVLKRSLPAAVAGLAAVGAVPLLAMTLPITRATEWIDLCFNSWRPAELAGVAAIAFTLGSLFAFRVRRADRFGLRRASGVLLGAGMVLGPAFGATLRHAAWAFDIERGSEHAEIARADPSPDGRFIAVEVEQSWTARQEWLTLVGTQTGSRCRRRCEVWILDCESGAWNEIDDRFRMLVESPAWDPSGKLRTLSLSGTFGEECERIESIDPRTREVRSETPRDWSECLGHWCSEDDTVDGIVLTWRSKGIRLRLPKDTRYKCARRPGLIFHEQDGFIVRHELEPDCTTRLLAAPHSMWMLTPDDTLLNDLTQNILVDTCDGHVVRTFDPLSRYYRRSNVPGRICWIWHAGPTFTSLAEDGSETPLPIDDLSWQEFGPDKLLFRSHDRIECMKLDGTERRTLYEANR